MTLEQRLREELQWSADCITCDPNGRLEEVVSKARHRRRVQLVVTSALVVAVVGVGTVGLETLDLAGHEVTPTAPTQSAPDTASPSSSFDPHAEYRNPLTGDWLSEPFSSDRVRAAITSAGLTDADATRVLGESSLWSARMNFTMVGAYGPVVVAGAWDASRGVTQLAPGTQYPYDLLGHHRLVMTEVDSMKRLVFSYQIRGERLFMHLERAESDPLSDDAAALAIAWTAAPLRSRHNHAE